MNKKIKQPIIIGNQQEDCRVSIDVADIKINGIRKPKEAALMLEEDGVKHLATFSEEQLKEFIRQLEIVGHQLYMENNQN